jgi:hypothetical protein
LRNKLKHKFTSVKTSRYGSKVRCGIEELNFRRT